MKTKLTQKQIRFQAHLLFFITFFLAELCAVFLYQNQLKEAKLKADYTAQTTIGRVKSQLNHYLAESNLMKHMINDLSILPPILIANSNSFPIVASAIVASL